MLSLSRLHVCTSDYIPFWCLGNVDAQENGKRGLRRVCEGKAALRPIGRSAPHQRLVLRMHHINYL